MLNSSFEAAAPSFSSSLLSLLGSLHAPWDLLTATPLITRTAGPGVSKKGAGGGAGNNTGT